MRPALFCSTQAAAEALEMLSHHRILRKRLLKRIPALARLGPNGQLHSITEMTHDEAPEEMEEEGLSDDLFD